MNNRKHFQRGAGVFTCECCHGRTRMARCSGSRICEDCDTLGAIMNSTYDGHDITEYEQEIAECKVRIEGRGGKNDDAAELLALIASAKEQST